MENIEIKAALDALNTTNEAALKSLNDRVAKAEKEAKAARESVEHVETVLGRPGFGLARDENAPDETKHANMLNGLLRPGARPFTPDEAREYRSALDAYMRRGRDRVEPEQAEILRRVANSIDTRAMSIGSGPDGGYTVTPEMGTAILRAEQDFSPVRSIATVQPISSDAWEELVDTEVMGGATWVGEAEARAATASPTLKKLMIPTREIYAFPQVTQNLLDDSGIDVAAYVASKGGEAFAISEGASFVTGNGVTRPRGFTTYPTEATADSSRGWGTMEHVATGTNGSFGTGATGAEKLIDLVSRLRPGYRQGASWVMNRATMAQVRKLNDTAGQFVFQQSLVAGQPSNLLGYPIVELEDMATYSTTDALAIGFGNFARAYKIVDRIGMRLLRDDLTNKPYVGMYMTKRVGGDVVDFRAAKFLKFGNS